MSEKNEKLEQSKDWMDWVKRGAIALGGMALCKILGWPSQKKDREAFYHIGYKDGALNAYRDISKAAMRDPQMLVDLALKRFERDPRFNSFRKN